MPTGQSHRSHAKDKIDILVVCEECLLEGEGKKSQSSGKAEGSWMMIGEARLNYFSGAHPKSGTLGTGTLVNPVCTDYCTQCNPYWEEREKWKFPQAGRMVSVQ